MGTGHGETNTVPLYCALCGGSWENDLTCVPAVGRGRTDDAEGKKLDLQNYYHPSRECAINHSGLGLFERT